MQDVVIRAGKTFWQSTFAYIVTSIGASFSGIDVFDGDAIVNALMGVIIGAIAAGLSASYNGVIAPIIKGNGGVSFIDKSE